MVFFFIMIDNFLIVNILTTLEEGIFQEKYIEFYLEKQRYIKRTVKIIAIVFAFIGIVSWEFNKLVSSIIFVACATFQVLLVAEDLLFRSPEEIATIQKILSDYRKYNLEVFAVVTKIVIKNTTNEDLVTDINRLLNIKREILDIESNINLKENKKLIKRATKEVELYMKQLNPNVYGEQQ